MVHGCCRVYTHLQCSVLITVLAIAHTVLVVDKTVLLYVISYLVLLYLTVRPLRRIAAAAGGVGCRTQVGEPSGVNRLCVKELEAGIARQDGPRGTDNGNLEAAPVL